MRLRYRSLLLFLAQLIAALGVPALMLFGYLFAGEYAAARMGIPDFQADYYEACVVAILLLISVVFWPVSQAERRALLLLWIIRVGVALGAMLPYEAFYTLDAAAYYQNSQAIGDPFEWMAFGRGTDNITAFCALLRELTESYHAMKLIFAYLGMIAIFVFYRAATIVIGQERIALLYVLGMFPSILFWSSILGKDPVVLLGIAIFCYGAVRYLVRRELSALIWLFLGLFLAASMRVWLGVIFLGPLLATMVLTGRAPLHVKFGFLAASVPTFLIALRIVGQRFKIESAEDLVSRTDQISQGWARGGSAQMISTGFGSIQDMILFIPFGSFAALFRPLPGEVMNPFGMLAGVENGILLVLVLVGLWKNGFGWLREPVLLWATLTLVGWASIYGFASYQNLGTAFRFRVQVGPLLVLLALLLNFWPLLLDRRGAQSNPSAPPQGPPAPARY